MTITILCRVIDNFGDAGFVLRLACHLLQCEVQIISDDPALFYRLAPVLPKNIKLFSWQDGKAAPPPSEKLFSWSEEKEVLPTTDQNKKPFLPIKPTARFSGGEFEQNAVRTFQEFLQGDFSSLKKTQSEKPFFTCAKSTFIQESIFSKARQRALQKSLLRAALCRQKKFPTKKIPYKRTPLSSLKKKGTHLYRSNAYERKNIHKGYQFFNAMKIIFQRDESLISPRLIFLSKAFAKKTPTLIDENSDLHYIAECFECGRPEWLDEILFSLTLPYKTKIAMVDYLTAEPYARDFHKMKSLTRSSKVKKTLFMPGFENGTGGLLLPQVGTLEVAFLKATFERLFCTQKVFDTFSKSAGGLEGVVLYFSYEKCQKPLIEAFSKTSRKVLLASGAGAKSFLRDYDKSFLLVELPFIKQKVWDAIIAAVPLLFVRGEDSLAQAALSGNVFLWEAYPQTEHYQKVKVAALLQRMARHFSKEDFLIIKKAFELYNDDEGGVEGKTLTGALVDFIKNAPRAKKGYEGFSKSLKAQGDLADNLVEHLKSLWE